MRFPWQRSVKADDAIRESSDRLQETKRLQREMEPKLRRLERAAAHNGIVEAIVQGFKVVE